jgi:hypothetical protein
MPKTYKVVEGGMQDRFRHSRAKVQIVGGGFGNGKTAGSCVKALSLAKDYPGCNGLIARSTYPKLNDTIRKEFLSWCPREWIKRSPTKDDNSAYLTNGSVINFRYVSQKGTNTEASTSNLLSATYDWIIVDQLEDPEFVHKDFMDLMGRLRGSTQYVGNDPTMPKTGPRWFIATLNPTRNWCYRELVKPVHDLARGIISPKLLCQVDSNGEAVKVDGKPVSLIELFEGSTYENVQNIGEDYINGMLSTFTGTMRDRYVFGKWGALSGLVYPQYDETVHLLSHVDVVEYLRQLRRSGYEPTWLEAYDHGLKAPSCYELAFVDDDGNVFILDGFHAAEQPMATSAALIDATRDSYDIDPETLPAIYADPALFRRTAAGGAKVGETVAGMYAKDHSIKMQPGANDISSGIMKVGQYLAPVARHEHPITGMANSPHLFVSDKLGWWNNEVTEYYWKKNGSGDETDIPTDRNDHAMDTTKYLLTSRPKLAKFVGRLDAAPQYLSWHEIERNEATVKPRHR